MTQAASVRPEISLDPERSAVLSLGSNEGDSRRLILAAVERLEFLSATPPVRSSLWLSSPVDCPPGSPSFINAVVVLTPLPATTPEGLLDSLQQLEREFGRRPKEQRNERRPLDLDLIWFARELRQTAGLILPHPRAHLRRFVLQPLAEIFPEAVFPGQNLKVRELLARLGTDEQVSLLQDG